MSTILLFGLLAGVDNLQVAAAVGMSRTSSSRKWALVGAFAIFEALMPLVGAVVGRALAARYAATATFAGPLLLAGCGIVVLVSTFKKNPTKNIFDRPGALLALPLALSFDNLLAGAGFAAMGYPVGLTAWAIGGLSGLMCFAGMLLGDRIGLRWPARANAASGVTLVVVACLTLLSV